MKKIILNSISDFLNLSKDHGYSKVLRKILFLLESEGCSIAYKSFIEDEKGYNEEIELLSLEKKPLIRYDFFKKEIFNTENYLGYLMMRPSNSERPIYDSFIKTPSKNINSSEYFLICKKTYIFQHPLKKDITFPVEGNYFSQRDGKLGMCAHASLRMLSFLHDKPLTILDIKKYAGEPIRDRDGNFLESNGLAVPNHVNKVLEHLHLHHKTYHDLEENYSESLLRLPDNIILKNNFKKAYYDTSNRKLIFTEIMHKEARDKLLNLSEDDICQKVIIPDNLKSKLHYDASNKELIFTGIMYEQERDQLLKLSKDVLYQEAIKALFKKSQNSLFKMRLEEIVYTYLESGFPVLVVFNTEGRGWHMVVIVGHTFNSFAWWPEANDRYYQKLPYGSYLKSSSWISFIGHDDNFGPFLIFPMEFERIETVIAPLPFPIKIGAESIHPIVYRVLRQKYIQTLIGSIGTTWSESLLQHITDGNVLFRSFLIRKNEFIIKINETDMADQAKQFYNSDFFDPPEFFWITEISIPEIFSHQRYCLGEIISYPNPPYDIDDYLKEDIDNTEIMNLPDKDLNQLMLSIHLSGFIIKPDNDLLLKIKDDLPYKHISRKM